MFPTAFLSIITNKWVLIGAALVALLGFVGYQRLELQARSAELETSEIKVAEYQASVKSYQGAIKRLEVERVRADAVITANVTALEVRNKQIMQIRTEVSRAKDGNACAGSVPVRVTLDRLRQFGPAPPVGGGP